MTDTELALKPCPFCGHTGQVFLHSSDLSDDSGWAVLCGGKTDCAASVGRHVPLSKPEAIAAWNRRALASDRTEREAGDHWGAPEDDLLRLQNETYGEFGEKIIGKQTLFLLVSEIIAWRRSGAPK